ncbi:TerC family protein [Fictibacillus barbaricus]|uniref:TerC family protein n=1 Tax=Fictibacillus barbaricus TaxID=182136 RepID=A0ABS2Z9R7_9BACL|nr:TerC family protein [Fictibacillus barbaricus]MBN3544635.1 TerC family protein [Fictibacillus barbaricus]GGB65153.1 membrane protein [Fictibacillus barbaricus]
MDLFAPDFWSALLAIVVIDLVLAGDNAIVIGLAARNLPKENQKKVIIWGTVGAIVIRAVATLAVVWLLKIPGLLLAGGLILLYIAYKLMVEEKDHDIEAQNSVWAAIRTIIIADAVMGLDNVLAVAGAAHGDFLLVVIGLLISVPIVVWGSTLFLKLIDKYPFIITIGAGVLAWTASKMIVGEKFMKPYFENDFVKYGFEILMIIVILGLGALKKRKTAGEKAAEKNPSNSEA